MRTTTLFMAVLAAAAVTSAKDFPLQFKTIDTDQVTKFPGGYGMYGRLTVTKPKGMEKAPQAISKVPLYGELAPYTKDSETILVWLDESKGDGKGYDTLVVDLNGNGDLTDDPSAGPADREDTSETTSDSYQSDLFGPITLPEDKQVAGGRPVYYGQCYIHTSTIRSTSSGPSDRYLGYLRLRAGWYLEATVEVGGQSKKVGLIDGDANLQLGFPWKPRIITSGTPKTERWYFYPGDSFLVDTDDSGAFENNRFGTEQFSYGPLLYFGPRPHRVTVASDRKSIRVEPWADSLADISLEPHGELWRTASLAREMPDGTWQLVEPIVNQGRVKVPPGKYRFYANLLMANTEEETPVLASGYYRETDRAVQVEVGKATALRYGAPLELKVTAEKARARNSGGMLRSLGQLLSNSDSSVEWELRISASVVGAGGESYAAFGKGKGLDTDAPEPVYTILDAEGKKLASGNLEFG